MSAIRKKSGHYLGTRIEHKWWRRYTEEGFMTRGNGEYWIADGSLFFQHRARQDPIHLPLCDIVEVALSPCKERAPNIGRPVVHLTWKKDGRWLSSGFILSSSAEETSNLLVHLSIRNKEQ